jgi:hypothetical protein
MMIDKHPLRLIIIGFFLLVAGVAFPLLMMLQMIESTFWLNFLSFGAQVSGLFLGFIGGTMYIKANRKN